MKGLVRYFYTIKLDKIILWCYLIWYVVVVCFHFDPSPKIWINSLGISVVIGTGLMLSVAPTGAGKKDHWQTFRLYLMPFCVSSFSALIKESGFFVVVPPNAQEIAVAVLSCVLFLLAIAATKSTKKNLPSETA